MIRNLLLGSLCACLLATPAVGGRRQSAGRVRELVGLFHRHRRQHDLLRHVQAARHAAQRAPSARAIYLMVSDWPGRKVKAEPEIVPGYEYKDERAGDAWRSAATSSPSSPATMASSGSAWLQHLNDNQRLIDAMSNGVSAVAIGTSSRGTKTMDTYSPGGLRRRARQDSRRLQHVMRESLPDRS